MSQFYIRSFNENDDDGNPLFWNNEWGWVNQSEADIFSGYEMIEFDLPMGGIWQKI